MEENCVIVRYSEIAVKGPSTRARMEALLRRNLEEAMSAWGVEGIVHTCPGRLIIRNPTPSPAEAARVAARVFGVKSASPAVEIAFKDLEDLAYRALEWFAPRARGKIFRVRARRTGSHPFTSKDVERIVGSLLLEAGASRVDLENPEYTAYIEVRDDRAYLYDSIVPGPGGLPLGSEGPVLVLFSGGFDSAATAWLLMRRGARVSLAYYDLGPREALETAVKVAVALSRGWSYGHRITFYRIDFSNIARRARRLLRPEYRVLAIRRAMLVHAEHLALERGFEALATGESLGQVASQTLRNMRLVSTGLKLPVLRPLAGSDKDEIVDLTRRIGVYEEASRQIEVCGRDATPTPRGDPGLFNLEYRRLGFNPSEPSVGEVILREGVDSDDVLAELLRG